MSAAPTVPCPGCRAPMELEQEVCGACRRPRDESEVAAGKQSLADAAAERRRLPFKVLRWLVLAGAVALLYRSRAFFLARFSAARAELSAEMKEASDPSRDGPKTELGRRLIAAMGGPRRRGATTAVFTGRAAARTPPAPPRLAHREAARGVFHQGDRKAYGVVYEMMSGLAVADATVLFHLEGQSVGPSAVTDESGYYEIDFNGMASGPPLLVSVLKGGRELYAMDDSDPAYFDRTPEMKREDLAALRDHDMPTTYMTFAENDRDLPRNFVVVSTGTP